jgi:hypothetical protein
VRTIRSLSAPGYPARRKRNTVSGHQRLRARHSSAADCRQRRPAARPHPVHAARLRDHHAPRRRGHASAARDPAHRRATGARGACCPG